MALYFLTSGKSFHLRNFIKQSLDDEKINVVCKDDMVPVTSQENEDAYTKDPTMNQQAQKESYYMNVKGINL